MMRPREDERGAVAVITAASMTLLLVSIAMVLDFGLVRLDRQDSQSAADSAVMSGLRAGDGGNDRLLSFRSVCGALQFLKASRPSLTGLPDGVCTTPVAITSCSPTNPDTWATYTGTTTSGGADTTVTIKNPAPLAGPADEALPIRAGDTSLKNGCDQLSVTVTITREPGFGSLATSSDLVTTIRSVGRVMTQQGNLSPALLLLERTLCSNLTVGSAGSPSRIQVLASGTMPGTVHADSDGTGAGCGTGSNQQVFQGKQTGGIVAYGTGSQAGIISNPALLSGLPQALTRDSNANVFGTTAPHSLATGTTYDVQPRDQVTRQAVDERYLPGVAAATRAAYPRWGQTIGNATQATAAGYSHYFACANNGTLNSAQMTTLAALPSTASVYLNCDGNNGSSITGSIGAGTVYLHGFVKSGQLSLPNATLVLVDNAPDAADAIGLTANGSFLCIRQTCTSAALGSAQCSTAPTGSTAAQATVLVRRGQLSSSGGTLFRACNTRVVVLGGDIGANTSVFPGACLPTSFGTPPTATPCPASTAGSGRISLSGATDWTAPNAYGSLAALDSAAKSALWAGGEDLALWDETYGTGSDFKMAGGGLMRVGGVFMVPNAFPFTVTGSGAQDLTNSQFITRGFAVDGGATLTMQVNPDNSISLPKLGPFVLVR